MSAAWLPILAGGVGGSVLTNLAGEWRHWRTNRRDDRTRFDADRLASASEVSRLSADARRLQVQRLSLRAARPLDDAAVGEVDARYQSLAEAISGAAARFRLLFPAKQRAALQRLLDDLDALTSAVSKNHGFREALTSAQRSETDFVESCRQFLVALKD